MQIDDYPYGIDWEWFAVDAMGYVAVFTTAGSAPIPLIVLKTQYETDVLDDLPTSLPVRGWATLLVSLPRPDDYEAFAERGLFAYAWNDGTRDPVHELYSRPTAPITVSELPPEVQFILQKCQFTTALFTNTTRLDVEVLMECRKPSV